MNWKLLVQSAMIFFGTLLAAALVALGEPSVDPVAWLNVLDFQALGEWLRGVTR
jgi:hypothetical protein